MGTGLQDKIMEPYLWFHDRLIEKMPAPKYELGFFDAGHFAFSDLCGYADVLANGGDGCGPGRRIGTGEPFMNPAHDRMHKVLDAYATAFFGATFFGDAGLVEYLETNHFKGMMRYSSGTE